jgi:hypothetical protein
MIVANQQNMVFIKRFGFVSITQKKSSKSLKHVLAQSNRDLRGGEEEMSLVQSTLKAF